MDPLSITTSVITLIGAANNVYNCLQSIRHADRALQSLVKEVNTLNGFLGSIERALEGCRENPYALTHIDPALWKESKLALSDCQGTLDQLGMVFSEPKRPSRSNTLFRRARVAAELHSRAGEIASFREKISMSNMSLQTLLQVINVSLSLRGNESHDNILRELKELKHALKKSSQAATVSYSTLFLNEKDTSLVHHLKGLIRAAQDFHSSASVTASTVVGSGGSQPPPTDFGDDDARSGIASRLPSVKREQIETYLSQNQPMSRAGTPDSSRERDETVTVPALPKSPRAEPATNKPGSSNTFSTIFTSGFSKIAQRALQQLDLEKADGLLKEALKWHSSSGSDDIYHHRRLQTQLALCSLLRGNCQEAQDLILDLFGSSTKKDTIAIQLIYALTLLQLHELDFEGARDNSTKLWEALQKMHECTVLGANDAMRILAISYQESGDSLLADAIEAEVPELRLFEPVPKMTEFLASCDELLIAVLGPQDGSEPTPPFSMTSKIHDLPIAKKLSSLQMRGLLLENVRSSNSESASSEAGDSLSGDSSVYFEIIKPKVKKRSWSNLRTLFKPRLWDIGTLDLSPLSPGIQSSPSKQRKRAKTSHVALTSPHGPESGGNTSANLRLQTLATSKSSISARSDSVLQDLNPENTSRTMDWVIEQTDNETTDTMANAKPETTLESEGNAPEQPQQLHRKFSFQAGVSDDITARLPSTTTHEMPNNAVFELMDTSPRVKLPHWAHESYCPVRRPDGRSDTVPFHKVSKLIDRFNTSSSSSLPLYDGSIPTADVCFPSGSNIAASPPNSLETENDIYHLLGYGRASSFHDNLVDSDDIAVGRSSSESESNISSVFDELAPSTRQTTFNSSFGGTDNFTDEDEEWPLKTVKQIGSRHPAESISADDSPSHTSFNPTNNYGLHIENDEPLKSSGTLMARHQANDDLTQAPSLKFHTPSRREFGPAIARLCQYKSPRKTAFRRRLPGSTATRLDRLFRTHDGKDKFNFGSSSALYSGPDAVAGPFTEPGEIDLSGAQGTYKSTSWGDSTSTDSLRSTKNDPGLMGIGEQVDSEQRTPWTDSTEPPPYQKENLANRKRKWTRTQIDDFFDISVERPFLQSSSRSIACI
ncbi:hypothetical protein F4808DRAFT_179008 [Astrocystis sublimbata]|nr:hypothetical protein F4808DRAFT_179008 [Astrocystis sublimbata]